MTIAVTHSSSATGSSGATDTSSPTWTSTTGNLLVAVAGNDGTSTASAAAFTDSGGSNTWANTNSSNVSSTAAAMGYAKNITGHTLQAVTFHQTGTSDNDVALIEVSGCDTVSPQDVAVVYTSTSSATNLASSLITPPAGDRLIVVVAECFNGTAQTVANAGTGTATWTTIVNNSQGNTPLLMAYAIVTADGSHTYGVTYNTGGSAGAIVVGITAFKAAGGAVQDTPELRGMAHGLRGQQQMQQLLAV